MPVLLFSGYAHIAGGGQISLLLLLKHLDRQRFSPILLCPDEGEVAHRARSLGIEVKCLGLGRSADSLSAIRHTPALRRQIIDAGVCLVHCDTLYAAVMCGIGLQGLQIPTIFHARSSESGGVLDAIVSRLCAKIICVSHATGRRFSPRFLSKVHVVYNGVDLVEFRPGAGGSAFREKLGILKDTFVVGYAGQILGAKGLDILIEAFTQLRILSPDSRLLIVGRGSDEATLREAAGDGVQFLSFSDSMPAFYSALDVFVLPTDYHEGLSRSLIESMACAVPSITTPLGGNAETVVDGETGIFIPPRNSEQLYARMRDLHLAPERRRRMGNAARHRAEALFDAVACARKVEAVYLQTCA